MYRQIVEDTQDSVLLIRLFPYRPKKRIGGFIKAAKYDNPVLPSRLALCRKYYYFVNNDNSPNLDGIISTWDLPIFTGCSDLRDDSEQKEIWFQGPPDDDLEMVLRRYLVGAFGHHNPSQLQFILVKANPAIRFGHRSLGRLNQILESHPLS